jgi:hypothetical protein
VVVAFGTDPPEYLKAWVPFRGALTVLGQLVLRPRKRLWRGGLVRNLGSVAGSDYRLIIPYRSGRAAKRCYCRWPISKRKTTLETSGEGMRDFDGQVEWSTHAWISIYVVEPTIL